MTVIPPANTNPNWSFDMFAMSASIVDRSVDVDTIGEKDVDIWLKSSHPPGIIFSEVVDDGMFGVAYDLI